ncbi:uncharacterized protein LOC133331252, partial [Musca vetustissima]|uniref:uncharacterized protein LOC133331252 n=1 Tax=Musca vetustissima TaxID=27455 RepID=UPI002AB6A74D
SKKSLFSLDIQDVRCEVCNDWVLQHKCHVEMVDNNTYAFSFLIALNRELPPNTYVRILVDVRPLGGQKVVHFLNMELKVCDALENLKTNPLVMVFLRKMIHHSNLPLACPIRKNVLYNISDLSVNEELIPSYAPSTDFNVTLAFYQLGKYLGNVVCQGIIKRLK